MDSCGPPFSSLMGTDSALPRCQVSDMKSKSRVHHLNLSKFQKQPASPFCQKPTVTIRHIDPTANRIRFGYYLVGDLLATCWPPVGHLLVILFSTPRIHIHRSLRHIEQHRNVLTLPRILEDSHGIAAPQSTVPTWPELQTLPHLAIGPAGPSHRRCGTSVFWEPWEFWEPEKNPVLFWSTPKPFRNQPRSMALRWLRWLAICCDGPEHMRHSARRLWNPCRVIAWHSTLQFKLLKTRQLRRKSWWTHREYSR